MLLSYSWKNYAKHEDRHVHHGDPKGQRAGMGLSIGETPVETGQVMLEGPGPGWAVGQEHFF